MQILVCMYVCMYACISIRNLVGVYDILACRHSLVYEACMYMCVCVCMYVHVCTCVHDMHVCIHVCMHVDIHGSIRYPCMCL